MRLNFKVYRYELIFVLLVLILTGSASIISKSTQELIPVTQSYPYSVALTFDDGPYPQYTQKLLTILESENVKATFFVIGRHAQDNPELMKMIAVKGHEFGGHTFNHSNIKHLSYSKLLSDLSTTRDIIEKTTGEKTYLFRPPGGQYNKKSLQEISQAGYTTVLWSILPKDCEASVTKKNISDTVLTKTHTNDIVLLHMGRERTLEALPEIICSLRLKGFKFVTVSELLDETSKKKEN